MGEDYVFIFEYLFVSRKTAWIQECDLKNPAVFFLCRWGVVQSDLNLDDTPPKTNMTIEKKHE